jgi:RNA polymerase sigma-70 factor, ECF subfamily
MSMSSADFTLVGLVVTDEQPHDTDGSAGDAAVLALVVRAQGGDQKAFGDLVSRFQSKVLTTAWRLLRDREDALDAAQETFVRLFKYIDTYDRSRDFGAWIYRITVNVSHGLAKRRGRSFEPVSEVIAPSTSTPADSRDLQRAMETLTEKERTALVLRDLEGLPTEEVARILGSSPTTVRVHICAARKKIRRYLEGTKDES